MQYLTELQHSSEVLAFSRLRDSCADKYVGLQSFVIVSDPRVAKHILKDNAKGYSKVQVTFIVATLLYML